jgi:hypothetical protein
LTKPGVAAVLVAMGRPEDKTELTALPTNWRVSCVFRRKMQTQSLNCVDR